MCKVQITTDKFGDETSHAHTFSAPGTLSGCSTNSKVPDFCLLRWKQYAGDEKGILEDLWLYFGNFVSSASKCNTYKRLTL